MYLRRQCYCYNVWPVESLRCIQFFAGSVYNNIYTNEYNLMFCRDCNISKRDENPGASRGAPNILSKIDADPVTILPHTKWTRSYYRLHLRPKAPLENSSRKSSPPSVVYSPSPLLFILFWFFYCSRCFSKKEIFKREDNEETPDHIVVARLFIFIGRRISWNVYKESLRSSHWFFKLPASSSSSSVASVLSSPFQESYSSESVGVDTIDTNAFYDDCIGSSKVEYASSDRWYITRLNQRKKRRTER